MTARTLKTRSLQKGAKVLAGAMAALLCAACASGPQSVREQASSALSCDASQLAVNRIERRYGADHYEAVGCGQKLTYECERAYVVFIPVGTVGCHKK
ncbi:MAG TPA: hypothetical protein VGE08_06695 [Steroidobacter sp.]|uniref:hypothetical protein n=1 Tax=Steroidobacter sp. TaxID=1978227 RepID=UPI002ED9F95D